MRFHRKVSWKCIQVWDWTKIFVLNMVTWDSMVRWTENASKYKIELKSVYVHGNFKCNIRFIGIS